MRRVSVKTMFPLVELDSRRGRWNSEPTGHFIKEILNMEDLKTLFAYYKEHKRGVIVTLIATVIGAALGVAVFYNGWLG